MSGNKISLIGKNPPFRPKTLGRKSKRKITGVKRRGIEHDYEIGLPIAINVAKQETKRKNQISGMTKFVGEMERLIAALMHVGVDPHQADMIDT